jgi:hypothetical protein
VIAMMIADARKGASTATLDDGAQPAPAKRRRRFRLPWLIPQPAPQSVGQLETRKGT